MPTPASSRPIVDSATLFGRCIAVIRADLGLTQAQMAAMLRVSRPTLTHFETGRATPSFHVLLRLGQRVAKARVDSDATAAPALLHPTASALQADGIRVLNRPDDDPPVEDDPPAEDDDILARLDKAYRAVRARVRAGSDLSELRRMRSEHAAALAGRQSPTLRLRTLDIIDGHRRPTESWTSRQRGSRRPRPRWCRRAPSLRRKRGRAVTAPGVVPRARPRPRRHERDEAGDVAAAKQLPADQAAAEQAATEARRQDDEDLRELRERARKAEACVEAAQAETARLKAMQQAAVEQERERRQRAKERAEKEAKAQERAATSGSTCAAAARAALGQPAPPWG